MDLRPDVLIVGAGTAGAAAAALCARRGLRVLCIDHRGLEQAGARWVNGVPAWAFRLAGFAPPRAPERLAAGVPFHLIAGWGPERVVLRQHDLLEVDMRLLVARLHEEARRAGAALVGEVRVGAFDGSTLDTSLGALRPRWFVDAAGLGGPRLLGQRRPPPEDLCVAAQEVRRVRDPQAARAWVQEHGGQEGETLAWSGVNGGYSVVNVRVEGEHVSILTGSIPALGHVPGPAMLLDFVTRNPWVGERLYGGARAIPLGPPLTVVGRERVAALGDAAMQVHGAHGSGIAQGLVAARVLADELAAGFGPEGYNTTWQRRFGGPLAAADLFRRFAQTLDTASLRRMFSAGVMQVGLARQVLEQRAPHEALGDLPAAALGLLRAPDLALKLAPALARMTRVEAWYARYPESAAGVPAWEQRLLTLGGGHDRVSHDRVSHDRVSHDRVSHDRGDQSGSSSGSASL